MDAKRLVKEEQGQLVDVREPSELRMNAVPEAVNMPLYEFAERSLNELNPHAPVILFCHSGARSQMATQYLKDNGFKQVYNLGSFMAWHQCAG
ncbi:rhodanese-like domain-containing protein [Thiomicrospira sp. ALE5]|uniref:rhodanese-like domain-containing protein n=1 Tax=Thiomicrospira sp. ALE5 TaxID=748650 RepID=UPI0008EB2338|nr:rhodanese-like domain-containing protein [Thiomicrospira sp. ALE5]SFR50648.1 Rhodanese-related sulfurtransferase [Thiomicrospira sp. ALE5]